MTIEWTAPAGGSWELETLHVRGGQPRIFQERAPRAFRDGFADAAARYGLPIDYLDVRFVNDHCYARMRPVGAPEPTPGKASTPPPDLVLKLLARLHPELRQRTKTARRAISQRLWHRDRRRWEEHDRPDMLATGRALQAEPLEQLDDHQLIDHLRRTADHFERGIAMHLGLTPVHNLPVGRLVQACRTWERLPVRQPVSHRPRSTTCAPPVPPPTRPSIPIWPTTRGGRSRSIRREA